MQGSFLTFKKGTTTLVVLVPHVGVPARHKVGIAEPAVRGGDDGVPAVVAGHQPGDREHVTVGKVRAGHGRPLRMASVHRAGFRCMLPDRMEHR